jgi:hypothetical protein
MANKYTSQIVTYYQVLHAVPNCVLFFFLFVVLGLELRANTLSHSTSPFL